MKPNKIPLIFAIVIVFFMGIFYYGLVNTNQKDNIFEMRKVLPATSNILQVEFKLPFQDEYLLAVQHLVEKGQARTVFLNGHLLGLKFSKKLHDILTEYYRMPAEISHKGSNSLKIDFYSGFPPEVEIQIGNYISRESDGNVFFLSKESRLVKNRPKPILYSLIFVVVLFLIWQVSFYLWRMWFRLSDGEAILHNVILFSPSFLVMGLAWAVSNYSPQSLPVYLLISSSYLYSLVIFTIILMQIIIGVFVVSWRKFACDKGVRLLLEEGKKTAPLLSEKTMGIILEEREPEWVRKAIAWIERREFSDKCILLFMSLLILAAFLLILRLEWVAEQLANIAYFALVVGVGIKLVDLVRGK